MVLVVADVEVTREGAILTITLNRPDVLNALNRSMHAQLLAALGQAKDPEIRAVVLTGAGRGFCVGQDLQEFSSGAGDVADNLRRNYHRNVLALRALEKPVIAAVNGPAAGAGLSLALACDIRIAADTATFVPAFINIGLVPDSGGTWLAHRILGTTRAFEWLTTGRRLPADEGRAWGLVNEVVPAGELLHRAQEVAALYAAMPTRAVGQTKRLLDHAETATFEEQLELEAVTQAEQTQTRDFREGVAAFLAKREPAFTGAEPERAHPITVANNDNLRRWRLTVALRYLLALPHLYLVYLWSFVALAVGIVNWFIALVRGDTPPSVRAWFARYLRYSTHVLAYTMLLADPYPKFRGWPGTYPVDLRVDPPHAQRRWTILLRLPLAVPALIFSYVLNIVASVVAILGWFAALATARMPVGLQRLGAYCLRFQVQTLGYLLLVTDRYPTLANEYVLPVRPASSSEAAGRT
jgi:2-(1,2-epoxy-1,2-dihydrophenyl)acetyl-CoA isomerase